MCKACDKGVDIAYEYVKVTIDKDNSVIKLDYEAYSTDSSFNVEIPINYCPICGKKLKK